MKKYYPIGICHLNAQNKFTDFFLYSLFSCVQTFIVTLYENCAPLSDTRTDINILVSLMRWWSHRRVIIKLAHTSNLLQHGPFKIETQIGGRHPPSFFFLASSMSPWESLTSLALMLEIFNLPLEGVTNESFIPVKVKVEYIYAHRKQIDPILHYALFSIFARLNLLLILISME